MKSTNQLMSIASMALVLAVSGAAWAQTGGAPAGGAPAPAPAPAPTDESFVLYRQKVMSANFANCSAIGDILKTGLPYKNEIPVHAKLLRGNVGMITTAFKKKIAEGKTDAKAAVWDDWAKFEGKVKALDAEIAKLETVAAKGKTEDIAAQFAKVGGACKSCHDDFKKPPAESYKTAK
jgi:cytochrome c556